MRANGRVAWVTAVTLCLLTFFSVANRAAVAQTTETKDVRATSGLPSVVFHEAPLIQMPGVDLGEAFTHFVDCNSPAHWDGDTLYLFNSIEHPWRTSGPELWHLSPPVSVRMGKVNDKLPIWIESTWRDDDGTLYGAYHYEPDAVCFSNNHLPTVPKVGWIRSTDNGASWEDLGFVIAADPSAIKCNTESPWDAGGHGDFVALPDQKKEYFYFFGTSYDPRFEEQGIWLARMRFTDRDRPSGKVWKWYQGSWSEPGLGGHVTPIFPAERDYHRKDGIIFWGPVVHWNTYLNTYVMALNHSIDTVLLTQDGIYLSFNSDLDNPKGWSEPKKFLDRPAIQKATAGASTDPRVRDSGWYVEIIGTKKGETDKLLGRTGRFFMAGLSRLEIIFLKPGEKSE